jgi:hypothetical protein
MGLRRRRLVGSGGLGGVSSASMTCTTTGAGQTLTLQSLGITTGQTAIVSWGDGLSDTYTGTATRTHVYAAAGTYPIKISNAPAIIVFDVRDNKLTVNSADIKGMINVQTVLLTTLKAGRFNSADVAAWTPTTFYLVNMPAGYAGTFDSADVAAWTPTTFQLYSMPTATFTITISAGGFAGWKKCTSFDMKNNSLSAAAVTQIGADFWAGFATRTATGGTGAIGGSGGTANAAPTGTYQAANPPDEGKEYLYELVNDSQNINPTKKWTTWTYTA